MSGARSVRVRVVSGACSVRVRVVSGVDAPGAGRATPVVEQLVALAWSLAEAPAAGHATQVVGP